MSPSTAHTHRSLSVLALAFAAARLRIGKADPKESNERKTVKRITISETQRPPAHPFYGDSWVRGIDPWHVDAAPEAFKGHHMWNRGERQGGYFLTDAWDNEIGWVPDGTAFDIPDDTPVLAIPDARLDFDGVGDGMAAGRVYGHAPEIISRRAHFAIDRSIMLV